MAKRCLMRAFWHLLEGLAHALRFEAPAQNARTAP